MFGNFYSFFCGSLLLLLSLCRWVVAIIGVVMVVGVWLVSSTFIFLQTLKKSVIYIILVCFTPISPSSRFLFLIEPDIYLAHVIE